MIYLRNRISIKLTLDTINRQTGYYEDEKTDRNRKKDRDDVVWMDITGSIDQFYRMNC